MDPLQVHKNGKIFLLLDTEIGAVGHITSMAILPAGALIYHHLLTATISILNLSCFSLATILINLFRTYPMVI